LALDLGTLTGYLEMDDAGFTSVLDKLPGKIDGSSKVLKGAAALAAGGIALALAGGINNALDLQDANANLSAQLGLTTEESARLGGVAGRLYSDAYGDSIEGVNSAVAQVVSSIGGMRDASAADVEEVTAKVLNMATAFEVDTGRAAQVAGQLISAGLADGPNEAIDLLTANLQRVPTALREDLLDAADEYGPFFAQLGLSGEEAMNALVKGSEQGTYGIDKTGDALKELTIRATDMSTSSVAAYEAAGLNADEMAAKFLAGGEQGKQGLDQLVQGLLGIQDPTAQANAAIGLFGTPLEDLGVGKIPSFLESLSSMNEGMGSTAGAADELSSTVNGTARVGWEGLTRQFEQIIGVVGAGLLPMLEGLIGFLADNPAVVTAMAIGIGILAVAFIALTVATWAMNTALLANPITWVVIAIVALIAAVVLLVTHWDVMVAGVKVIWGGFIGWITGVIDGFVGWWNDLWGGIGDGLGAAWQGALDWFAGLGATIMGLLQAGLQVVLDLFLTWSPLGIIISNWQAIVDWFAGLPQMLLGVLAGAGEWLLGIGEMILQGLATGIALGIIGLVYLFTQFPTDLVNWLVGAATWLIATGSEIMQGLLGGIVTGWESLVAWFTGLPMAIAIFLITAGTWLVTNGTQLIDGLRSGVTTAWANVVAFFTSIPAALQGIMMGAATWLITHGRDAIDGLRSGVTTAWTNVVAFFVSIPAAVMGFLAGAASWLVSAGRGAIDGMRTGITGAWSSVTSFLSGLPGQVTSAVGDFGQVLYGKGRDLVNGLLNGVRSLAGTVGSFFLGLLPGWIVGPFKAALGIASPSKLFRSFGINIGEGLLQGVDLMQNEIDATMRALVTTPDVPSWGMGSVGAAEAAGGRTGPLIDARMTIEGNVGFTAETLAEMNRENMTRALALTGADEIQGA
jgi:hypothetical protein